jgi:hypothetical protein
MNEVEVIDVDGHSPTPVQCEDMGSHTQEVDKRTAAQTLGVSEKTIDRMVERGELSCTRRKLPGQPERPMYPLKQIQKLSGVSGKPAESALATVPQSAPSNGPTTQVIAFTADQFSAMLDRLAPKQLAAPAAPATKPELPPSELRFKLYLTTREAVSFTGLSAAKLKELAASARLGRSRWNRRLLEKLSA